MSNTYKDRPWRLKERQRYKKQRHLSKHLLIGVGGVYCTCCFPAPGSKQRKADFRRAKRLDERDAFNMEKFS